MGVFSFSFGFNGWRWLSALCLEKNKKTSKCSKIAPSLLLVALCIFDQFFLQVLGTGHAQTCTHENACRLTCSVTHERIKLHAIDTIEIEATCTHMQQLENFALGYMPLWNCVPQQM